MQVCRSQNNISSIALIKRWEEMCSFTGVSDVMMQYQDQTSTSLVNFYKLLMYNLKCSYLKGAMSQETGLETPCCWPQYKRMFLVRAMCIDCVGALS